MALLLVTGNQPWSERLASAASARLAAAVGGVAIGREQQRHMIVRAGIGHPEAQRNHIQEARLLGLDALGTQVVAGVEDQLVLADGEALALEDRLNQLENLIARRVRRSREWVSNGATTMKWFRNITSLN